MLPTACKERCGDPRRTLLHFNPWKGYRSYLEKLIISISLAPHEPNTGFLKPTNPVSKGFIRPTPLLQRSNLAPIPRLVLSTSSYQSTKNGNPNTAFLTFSHISRNPRLSSGGLLHSTLRKRRLCQRILRLLTGLDRRWRCLRGAVQSAV